MAPPAAASTVRSPQLPRLRLLALLLAALAGPCCAQNLGACYGLYNYALPATAALPILRDASFNLLKTYWSNSAWLDTVQAVYGNTSVGVTIAISNADLAKAATNQNGFVDTLINTTRAHRNIVRYIAIGNEPFAAWNRAEAMPNLLAAHNRVVEALRSSGLDGAVKVLIPWSAEVIINSYPVSSTVIDPGILPTIQGILPYIASANSVFSINLYPYFAYKDNYPSVSLDFALGNGGPTAAGSQLVSMIQGTRVALGKIGYGGVRIIVGETGWPAAGNQFTSLTYMQTYLSHVKDAAVATGVDIYVFEPFDEPNKPQGVADPSEYYYGFFTSTGVPKFSFSAATPASSPASSSPARSPVSSPVSSPAKSPVSSPVVVPVGSPVSSPPGAAASPSSPKSSSSSPGASPVNSPSPTKTAVGTGVVSPSPVGGGSGGLSSSPSPVGGGSGGVSSSPSPGGGGSGGVSNSPSPGGVGSGGVSSSPSPAGGSSGGPGSSPSPAGGGSTGGGSGPSPAGTNGGVGSSASPASGGSGGVSSSPSPAVRTTGGVGSSLSPAGSVSGGNVGSSPSPADGGSSGGVGITSPVSDGSGGSLTSASTLMASTGSASAAGASAGDATSSDGADGGSSGGRGTTAILAGAVAGACALLLLLAALAFLLLKRRRQQQGGGGAPGAVAPSLSSNNMNAQLLEAQALEEGNGTAALRVSTTLATVSVITTPPRSPQPPASSGTPPATQPPSWVPAPGTPPPPPPLASLPPSPMPADAATSGASPAPVVVISATAAGLAPEPARTPGWTAAGAVPDADISTTPPASVKRALFFPPLRPMGSPGRNLPPLPPDSTAKLIAMSPGPSSFIRPHAWLARRQT